MLQSKSSKIKSNKKKNFHYFLLNITLNHNILYCMNIFCNLINMNNISIRTILNNIIRNIKKY